VKNGLALIISLTHPPRPDVRGAIAKDHTPASFVLSQRPDAVTICEDQIRQIQDEDVAGRLGVDDLTQFVYMVGIEVTADREHDPSAPRAMNLQHQRRPAGLERKYHANGRGPESTNKSH